MFLTVSAGPETFTNHVDFVIVGGGTAFSSDQHGPRSCAYHYRKEAISRRIVRKKSPQGGAVDQFRFHRLALA
jgi:hypothetical protein